MVIKGKEEIGLVISWMGRGVQRIYYWRSESRGEICGEFYGSLGWLQMPLPRIASEKLIMYLVDGHESKKNGAIVHRR